MNLKRITDVSAIEVWRERLEFLETEPAIASDSAQKFKIQKDIQEAKKKIVELGGTLPSPQQNNSSLETDNIDAIQNKTKPIQTDVFDVQNSAQTTFPSLSVLRHEEPISRTPSPLGTTKKLKVEGGVIIIQQPTGGYRQFVLEPTGIISSENNLVRYCADTHVSPCGAPVFDDNMHVVGLHFFGGKEGNGRLQIDFVKLELRKHNVDFMDAYDSSTKRRRQWFFRATLYYLFFKDSM